MVVWGSVFFFSVIGKLFVSWVVLFSRNRQGLVSYKIALYLTFFDILHGVNFGFQCNFLLRLCVMTFALCVNANEKPYSIDHPVLFLYHFLDIVYLWIAVFCLCISSILQWFFFNKQIQKLALWNNEIKIMFVKNNVCQIHPICKMLCVCVSPMWIMHIPKSWWENQGEQQS